MLNDQQTFMKPLLFHHSCCYWDDVFRFIGLRNKETCTAIKDFRDCGKSYICQIAKLSIQQSLASYGIDRSCIYCLLEVGNEDEFHFRVEI